MLDLIKKHQFNLICAFIMICFGVYSLYLNFRNDKNLKEHAMITTCNVINVDFFPRGSGLWIYYEFKVKDSIYKSRNKITVPSEAIHFTTTILLNQEMPLVVDSLNLSNSEIITSKENYDAYKIKASINIQNIIYKLDSLSKYY
jgi:hypothetical protein